MENRQWAASYTQPTAMSLDGTDESLHNGICDSLLENADNEDDAGKKSDQNKDEGRIRIVEAAIRFVCNIQK